MDTDKIASDAMLKALQNQRNSYANEAVTLAVQNAVLSEKLKQALSELESLKAKKLRKKKEPQPL